jgi:hypothetical protein
MKTSRLILLAMPTLIAGIVIMVILNWHVSTRVRIALTTDRMSFKVGGQDKATILDSVGLKSVVIEKFETVKLRPESLSLVGSDKVTNRASSVAITQSPVVITAREGRAQSNVTLAADSDGARAPLVIDALNAKPSTEVFVESSEDPNDLILRVEGQQSAGSIAISEPFRIAVDQSEIAGVRGSMDLTQPLTLKARLIRNSMADFTSEDGLILTVTVPTENSTALLPQGHVLITTIKFEQLDEESGKSLSSLTRDIPCEVSYPDYDGKVAKVTLMRPDFLWLNDLENFTIEELTYTPGKKGISVKLLGVASKITSGSPEYSVDHRLTVYDTLWNNHKVVALFVVLCWVAGATASLYKLSKGN